MDVYVRCCRHKDGRLTLPVADAVFLFACRCCHADSLQLHLVAEDVTTGGLVFAPTILDRIPHRFVATAPPALLQCHLPAVSCGRLIHAGLCCALRCVVKHAHKLRPQAGLLSLLGHRGVSLKACAEVSPWTQYCEVELPTAVDQIRTTQNASDKRVVSSTLMKFENHLRRPPIIANRNKRCRQLRRPPGGANGLAARLQHLSLAPGGNDSGRDDSGRDDNGRVENGRDDNGRNDNGRDDSGRDALAEHVFAEGLDLTITDILIFPSISCLIAAWADDLLTLEAGLPRVTAWYRRMLALPAIQRALTAAGVAGQGMGRTLGPGPGQTLSSGPGQTLSPGPGHILSPGPGQTLNSRNENRDISKDNTLYIRNLRKEKTKVDSNIICNILEKVSSVILPVSEPPGFDDIQLAWQQLPSVLHPSEGELPWRRVERKCQQLESVVRAVQKMARNGDVIVDFCSGGGHLGILLAHLLPDCQVVLVENKEESILRAHHRLNLLNQTNVTLYQCNLNYFRGRFTIGVCLHACGTATDLVFRRCLENNASFVITPCCYGSIHAVGDLNYPRSKAFLTAGISYEDYLMLSRGADQTEFKISKEEQGKLCMACLDSDRLKQAAESGYTVQRCKLTPEHCSPKNHLLLGYAPSTNAN